MQSLWPKLDQVWSCPTSGSMTGTWHNNNSYTWEITTSRITPHNTHWQLVIHMTWKHFFEHNHLILTWKTLKTHITTTRIIYVWLVFINTHIHIGILQTPLFHHHIFELSLDLHLKHNCLWPSLMDFARSTILTPRLVGASTIRVVK